MEQKEKDKIVKDIMASLHKKSLHRKYISWGTFMRAGLKCFEEGKKNCGHGLKLEINSNMFDDV